MQDRGELASGRLSKGAIMRDEAKNNETLSILKSASLSLSAARLTCSRAHAHSECCRCLTECECARRPRAANSRSLFIRKL